MEREQRRHPRVHIELPLRARVTETDVLVPRLVDMSSSGMQLLIDRSDLESLRKAADRQASQNRFEIHITARLAWVMPDSDQNLRTGWQFDLADIKDLDSGSSL